jgi:hypothetical protein
MATGCGPGQQIPDKPESDELNLLEEGKYYGHPNHMRAQTDPRQCVWRSASTPSDAQYTAPLLKLSSSTDGIIEFASDAFGGQMRGNLIVIKYGGGPSRVILNADGRGVYPGTFDIKLGVGTQGLDGTSGNAIPGTRLTELSLVLTPVFVVGVVVVVVHGAIKYSHPSTEWQSG